MGLGDAFTQTLFKTYKVLSGDIKVGA